MTNGQIFVNVLKEKRRNREIAEYGRELTETERDALYSGNLEKESENQLKRDNEWINKKLGLFPKRFWDKTFSNYKCTQSIHKAAIEHLKTGASAIVCGSVGCGKTHLAYATVRYQVEKFVDAEYILAFDMFNQIKRTFNDDTGKETDRLMDWLSNIPYLVIDELDKTYRKDTEYVYLNKLINARYNNCLPTVLITNANEDELVDLLGASVKSRVAGTGGIINMPEGDYRPKESE